MNDTLELAEKNPQIMIKTERVNKGKDVSPNTELKQIDALDNNLMSEISDYNSASELLKEVDEVEQPKKGFMC